MASARFLRACDFLFVLRPLLLLPAWSFYLLGAKSGFKAAGGSDIQRGFFPPPATFLGITAILIFSYLLNQIFDKETDRLNKKVFFLNEGMFGVKTVLVFALLFFLLASYFFHNSAPETHIFLLAALLLSLLYSLPPLRFCARPILDLASNAAGFGGIAFTLGYINYSPNALQGIIASTPYILMVGSIFLFTTLLDLEGDRKTGKITTSVFLGEKASEILALTFAAFALAASLFLKNYYAVAITAISFVMCIYTVSKHKRKLRTMVVQAATVTVILAAASFWPVYFAAVIPLAILSRYYYAQRFNIIYPGVSEDS